MGLSKKKKKTNVFGFFFFFNQTETLDACNRNKEKMN